MPRLPQPATVSPGRLVLRYIARGSEHETGAHLTAATDVTDVDAMRDDAELFADAVKPMLNSNSNIYAWKVVNNDGVALYEEAFPTPVVGTADDSSGFNTAQSFSRAAIGKGRPEVGLQAGQTRTTIFPDFYSPTLDVDARRLASSPLLGSALIAFLNNNGQVGADVYGSKAEYRPDMALQFNAHIQKTKGL